MYSQHASLSEFRFHPSELGNVAMLMHWHGEPTKRSRNRRDSIAACYVVLRNLSTPCRWYDLETTFGIRSSKIGESFWEQVELFIHFSGHLVTTSRMDLQCIYSGETFPLPHCLGFIDCPKIQICRPFGLGSPQRNCYSVHKRMHCLVYQTLTTPDGLIFHLYGPHVVTMI